MLRFHKNNTKQVSEKARKSMRLFYITPTIWMFTSFVFALILPHIGYAATFTVNELVTFTPVGSTFKFTADTSGCPAGFAGKFSFAAKLTDKNSSPVLSDLMVQVATLTNENLLQNADAGPGGAGATLTVSRKDGFSDGFLSPGESVDVPFAICLWRLPPFTFFVNVLTASEPILTLSNPDRAVFDRVLFASDGSNTSEVFDAGSFRQATFRLAQRSGFDWDQYVASLSLVINAADSISGVPLLITKDKFTELPPQGAGIKTFFMAAFAVETVFHRNITIVTSPAFQLSEDPVVNIQLEVEGAKINVDPDANTPMQFASTGEKTVRAIVRFASGFVGENLFRVVVK